MPLVILDAASCVPVLKWPPRHGRVQQISQQDGALLVSHAVREEVLRVY